MKARSNARLKRFLARQHWSWDWIPDSQSKAHPLGYQAYKIPKIMNKIVLE